MRHIKYYRLMAEKSQRQIAGEVKCSQSLISMIEKGTVLPGKSLRVAISSALNQKEEHVFPGKFPDHDELNFAERFHLGEVKP